MSTELKKQISPTWQRLFAIFIIAVVFVVGYLIPSESEKILAVSAILLVLYQVNKARGAKMFSLRLNEYDSIDGVMSADTLSAIFAAASLVFAFFF
ncbi:hypothetical protein ICM05_09780 [Leucobacter sp. cx-42]|uniref:hypothetical protein n=1 Tax=unclassified Leucobacter TaxID=2621730 RepID=UPI00165EB805|nr:MULTISPECIES: hypothetical protein [unclassified Leucobacter]MBC9954927.1 hypothetical protein [Leucobacter sp. cx-42]